MKSSGRLKTGEVKGRLHVTVDVVHFLYAFNVKTRNILFKSTGILCFTSDNSVKSQ